MTPTSSAPVAMRKVRSAMTAASGELAAVASAIINILVIKIEMATPIATTASRINLCRRSILGSCVVYGTYLHPPTLPPQQPHHACPPLLALLVVSGLLFSPYLVCSSGYSFFAHLPTTTSYTLLATGLLQTRE